MSLKMLLKRSLVEADRLVINGFKPATRSGASRVAAAIDPGWVEVTQRKLTLPRLDPAFDGYRLAQFSDIHMDNWMTPERISQVVDLVNAQQPDLIAITGDFITHHAEQYTPSLTPLLERLSARDGVVAIRGNHDHWAGARAINRMLRASGIVNLCNSAISLHRGLASLHFAGVDDFYVHADRLDLTLKKLPPKGAAVLLAHEPDYADISSRTGRFDLQISGHTHGGQIDLPVVGRMFLPRHARKYPCGLYRVGGMWLYTNRGLGMSHFHIRYNAKSEVTLYTLESVK